jgi:5-methyltetrahydrofolate--homocysteine methyltransferase
LNIDFCFVFVLFFQVEPSFLGIKRFDDYDIRKIVSYIDWKPFFDVWQLKGKYPNRGYPKIFNDATVGAEAKKTFDNAQELLTDIIDNGLLRARAVIAFYKCNSNSNDDIIIYDETDRPIETLHGIRQQLCKDAQEENAYMCLSDFIAPECSNKKDFIGLFACGIFGADELCKTYEEKFDDFNIIMVKALADRLAEAFAEELHEKVRTNLWGYSKEERLNASDLHKIKYEGIRPAPGYPSQPDHLEKHTMWKLLEAEQQVGIQLTESLAMLPAAAVSGLYFSNPKSIYFATGKITEEQVKDYSQRKNLEQKFMEKWLSPCLAYEPVQ